ncbi:MAG: twin-arginine translocation signal domain-containing protein, partial [Sedimentisphaerales bacterium]
MNNGNKITRRQFVGTAAVAATAAFLQTGIVDSLHSVQAKQPSAGKTKSNIKVGLYSITFLGLWYRGK